MKIFITGGTGFIGTHLVRALTQAGHEITIVARNRNRGNRYAHKYQGVKYIYGDLLNNFSFKRHTKNVDIVIHLFWSNIPRSGPEFLKQDLINSVSYGIDLLQACVTNGVKKLIFASSGGTVYGIPEEIPTTEEKLLKPISSYGLTKSVFEKYIHFFHNQFEMSYAILRLSNVYGPGQNLRVQQGVMSHWLRSIIDKQRIELWGDGMAIRDYIYIDDVVSAFLKILELGSSEILNISSNKGVSLNELIDLLTHDLGLEFEVVRKSFDNSDVPINILDNSQARTLLNWEPKTELIDGLRNTYDYLMEQKESN